MRIRYLVLATAALSLTACMSWFGGHKSSEPVQHALMRSLTGQVEYSLPQPIPADAWLEVTLSDVSLMDAPSRTIAHERIAPVGTSPVEFMLTYDPADLGKGVDFAVSARLQQGDKLLAINDERVSVLGRSGQGSPVRVVLKAVP